MHASRVGSIVLVLGLVLFPVHGQDLLRVTRSDREVSVTHGDRPIARYVFRDEHVLRPYFTALHAPSGVEATRRHPPREGTDPVDHATMHPGLWLAFGDLGGVDFWRNKGRVEHEAFTDAPTSESGIVHFAVVNRYVDGDRLVCRERADHSLRELDDGWLLTWDSVFSSDAPFSFGDQEEMGLGVRMATGLCVRGGTGTILTSDGKQNEKEAWGTQADWCDYRGTSHGQRVGVLLAPHPENFRKSWLHVRDYGLLVANPFGRKALSGGEPSRVTVEVGESLRLRFGVWIYALPPGSEADPSHVAREYIRLSKD